MPFDVKKDATLHNLRVLRRNKMPIVRRLPGNPTRGDIVALRNANATYTMFFANGARWVNVSSPTPTPGLPAVLLVNNTTGGTPFAGAVSFSGDVAVAGVANFGGGIAVINPGTDEIDLGLAGTAVKVGTATASLVGFYGATPIVQPTSAVGSATRTPTAGASITINDTFGTTIATSYTVGQIVQALINVGILDS